MIVIYHDFQVKKKEGERKRRDSCNLHLWIKQKNQTTNRARATGEQYVLSFHTRRLLIIVYDIITITLLKTWSDIKWYLNIININWNRIVYEQLPYKHMQNFPWLGWNTFFKQMRPNILITSIPWYSRITNCSAVFSLKTGV